MRTFFTFCIALFSMTSLFAQESFVLEDFETGVVGFTTEVHLNPDLSFAYSVVDNPVKAGINTSLKVWKWQRLNTGDNQSWAGFWASLKTAVPAGYTSIEVKYLRTNATSQLRMKIEGTVTKEFNPVALATKTNEWETIKFDLTANGIQNINVLSLFPDNYSPVDPAALVYIDDIKVIYVKPPTINSLTLFANSTDNRFYDQGLVTQTTPSIVVTENWEGAGMPNGDKLPVVITPVKAGANALKLQYKSVATGTWTALVAAPGWTSLDLTKMKYIKFWVNSPVALAKTALPKFYLQSYTGSPNITGKLLMGSYLTTDLVANTWTEVTIPLADFWAADATFTSKNVIKGIYFEQNTTDNVEHTLYLDEFTFKNANIVLDDFESGTVSFTDQVNGNPPSHFDYAVVDNPFKTGINTSNKVWEWKRYDVGVGLNFVWAGFYATLKNAIPSGYTSVEVKYLRKNATSQLKLKLEGAVTKEMNPVTPASKTNEWETMVFDLTANGILNINVLGMFPDFYEPIDPTAVVYVDDIIVIKDETVIVPPPPATVTLFDNSADNRFYDPSYVNQTAPSTVVAEKALPTDLPEKLPVVTSPVKAGANALKLQWKSVDAGAWMSLVASIGFKVFDLTTKNYLKFWVNSPIALAKTALPKVHLESHTGNPNATGKLLLATYLPNGLTANTWTEVSIPLADLWAADLAFTSKDVIKGVFFTQNTADNVEHTLYLDEFTFASFGTGLDIQAAKNAFKVYYVDGEIRTPEYTGFIRVFDMLGRNVAEGNAAQGFLRVNLNAGIYIVNTAEGNAKIVLK
jgi:hypothetical protein